MNSRSSLDHGQNCLISINTAKATQKGLVRGVERGRGQIFTDPKPGKLPRELLQIMKLLAARKSTLLEVFHA